jgi:hypothetical protein
MLAALAAWCLVATPAFAQLSTQEGSRLRLVYFDGTESYLVPHAVRTFFNSLEFQRKLLGYEPTPTSRCCSPTSRTTATPASRSCPAT